MIELTMSMLCIWDKLQTAPEQIAAGNTGHETSSRFEIKQWNIVEIQCIRRAVKILMPMKYFPILKAMNMPLDRII
jgi:hypothetical protein